MKNEEWMFKFRNSMKITTFCNNFKFFILHWAGVSTSSTTRTLSSMTADTELVEVSFLNQNRATASKFYLPDYLMYMNCLFDETIYT